jgi:bifunctional ADP-heptose synthase (sugar kinase/adenylyltransferase)
MKRRATYPRVIKRFSRLSVLVVGDLIADEFIYGQIDRVSREAPVLILGYSATEVVPGGAGNAANNVAALGARVAIAGIVGQDSVGTRLLEALPRSARTGALVRPSDYVTPV